MKKIIKLLTILGVLLSAMGCLHEDNDCPEEESFNVSLDFLLPNKNNGCDFLSNVAAVDINIYDDEENLVLARYIVSEQLHEYKGIKLTLPPGKYNIVAWGNIDDDYIFHGKEDPDDPYNSGIAYDPLDDRFGSGSGKVYYAPRSGAFTRSGEMPGCYTMEVNPETGYKGTLEFRPAYRVIKVYVEGYSGTPMIGMIGLPMRLSWLGMERIEDGSGITIINMKMTEPYEEGGIIYDYAEFETFHFDGSNSIVLETMDPETLDANYSVLLNDVIEEINDPDETEISVLVVFGPAGVEVSVPDWHKKEVEPGVGI